MFTIGHINIRGYIAHATDITHNHLIRNLDCLCLSETHLSLRVQDSDLILPRTPTYLFRADCDSHGGSVVVCSKVVPPFPYRKTLVFTFSLEALTINISALNTTSLFVTVTCRRLQLVVQHTLFNPSLIYFLTFHTQIHTSYWVISTRICSPHLQTNLYNKSLQQLVLYTDFTRLDYKLRFIITVIRPHLHKKPSSPNLLPHLRHLLF